MFITPGAGVKPDSQPRVGKRGTFPHSSIIFFSQFGPPGGQLAHLGRPCRLFATAYEYDLLIDEEHNGGGGSRRGQGDLSPL